MLDLFLYYGEWFLYLGLAALKLLFKAFMFVGIICCALCVVMGIGRGS